MPVMFDWLAHNILSLRVEGVQNSATAAGGHCTWRFSQVKNPVRSLILTNPESSGGICEMLAAKWLEVHANAEKYARSGEATSLAGWISRAGGDIDPNKVRQIMQMFIIGSTMNSGALVGQPGSGREDQTYATERWLQSKGVTRRKHISSGPSWFKGMSRGSTGTRGGRRRDFSADIGRAITSSAKSYKMIGIAGPNFAHAVAAWSDTDVTFFDPNFGEFWFPTTNAFQGWFPRFWHLAGYGTPAIGLSDSYEIMEYDTVA
ncbi:YopT-type cysteine protease domain-containing protein [Hahella sp. HN01]|uniref:YopT-type cysteine protease domain-containing protein n=1 Tax=Hahella sp. HN01 TaxID=2847262 RepID=UPI001C1F1F4A|nr:YopT-type cysteine protease domain-containing protein [Hahella sp. HN01]MBU6954719.1 cysteine protease [Hahella sp. HN01]